MAGKPSAVANSPRRGDEVWQVTAVDPHGGSSDPDRVPIPFTKSISVTAIYDFLSPPRNDREIGRLGKYVIQKELGKGGMGIVFKAFDPKLLRHVALKVIRPDKSRNGRELLERFTREAKLLAQINNDNVVTIYDVQSIPVSPRTILGKFFSWLSGDRQEIPCIVMELLNGETLSSYVRRQSTGKLSPDDAIRIAIEIARGLTSMHKLRLVHRDIKPENIWIEEQTHRVKILDFGLARLVSDRSITRSGQAVGTPWFCPPEQLAGDELDIDADIYSLGKVLLYCLTGKKLGGARRLTVELPDVAPWIPELIEEMTNEDSLSRISNVEDVASALSGHVATLGTDREQMETFKLIDALKTDSKMAKNADEALRKVLGKITPSPKPGPGR